MLLFIRIVCVIDCGLKDVRQLLSWEVEILPPPKKKKLVFIPTNLENKTHCKNVIFSKFAYNMASVTEIN